MAALIQFLKFQLEKHNPQSNVKARILLKEVLQSFVLSYIYNHREYRQLNFYGGTCLRVIYGLDRMSEDIDLDNANGIDLEDLKDDLLWCFKNQIQTDSIEYSIQTSKAGIIRILLKFPILYDLGLSQHHNEKLHLKIETSHHPQTAEIKRTPINYYGKSFVPTHFSLETLFAGKILACLERSFVDAKQGIDFKGRDFYDLLWLMQRNVMPDVLKLQKDGKVSYTIGSAFEELEKRIALISPRALQRNLEPYLPGATYTEAWAESFHENFNSLKVNYTE